MGLGALLFSFRGRINRAKFWLAMLIYVTIYAIIVTIMIIAGHVAGEITLDPSVVAKIPFLILLNYMSTGVAGLLVWNWGFPLPTSVMVFLILVSALSVGAKRLHDRDKSAWWLLVFYGVSVLSVIQAVLIIVNINVLPLVLSLTLSPIVHYAFLITVLALQAWYFVELGCFPGTDGPNRYGPDPLAAAVLLSRA
jgi:uncharacterized membrane protein YhaH (DUF805 family)